MNDMGQKKIRLLIVDSDPGSKTDHQGLQEISSEMDIVGIAHSKRAAIPQAESAKPD